MPTCMFIDMSCTVGLDGSKTLPLSTLDRCMPCLFSIKVMATDYEQNTLLHHFTSVHCSNWALLWFTTYSVFKMVERKHHLWERDLSSKSQSSDWSHVTSYDMKTHLCFFQAPFIRQIWNILPIFMFCPTSLSSLWVFSWVSVSQAAGLQKQSSLPDEKLNHNVIGFPPISIRFSISACFVLLCLNGQ